MTTAEILARIPAAQTRWPGWWMTSKTVTRCSVTKNPGDLEREDLGYGDYRNWCSSCCESVFDDDHFYDTEEAIEPPQFCGPDLAKPENLHHLLEVCDGVCDCAFYIGPYCWPNELGHKFHCSPIRVAATYATGPTRTAACLAALAAALGLENT